MADTTVQPAPTEAQDRARAACHVARAWQQGRRLADLLTEHEVPAPERVKTSHTTGPREGQTHVYAAMRSAADLARLSHRAKTPIRACAGDIVEQIFVSFDLGGQPKRSIDAFWTGPVSAERAS